MFPLLARVKSVSSFRALYATQGAYCRAFSTVSPSVQPQIVPSEVLQPLNEINAFLNKKSSLDGRIRHDLYTNDSPFVFPAHEIEDNLPEITAVFKAPNLPQRANNSIRQDGKVPAIINGFESYNCNLANLSICIPKRECEELVRKYGRNGTAARVFKLKVVDFKNPDNVFGCLRVRPATVAMISTSLQIESFFFHFLPRDRLCKVRVPLRLINDDVAPGVKKGGWISMKQRLIPYQCRGDSVPPYIEFDAKNLNLEDKILKRHLPIPAGTRLLGNDYDTVILHCTTDVGKD